jgi:outer membrane lipoprotein-sorting protein
VLLVAGLACGCATSKKTHVKAGEAPAPLQTATKEQLVAAFNKQAENVKSLNAGVTMKLVAGTAYTGLIEEYHEVKGFILAQKPADIRVIGQAPVVSKDIFDMVSDGKTFRIFIPSKHKFLVGPANLERQSAKPIENLRPQHLLEVLLWEPISQHAPVLFEEASESDGSYYVLTILRRPGATAGVSGATDGEEAGSKEWEIGRKVWFERVKLTISRVEIFGAGGKVNSDVRYGVWEPAGAAVYPRQITLRRPGNDYQLGIEIKKVALGESIAAEKFELAQPAGTELVNVDEANPGAKP